MNTQTQGFEPHEEIRYTTLKTGEVGLKGPAERLVPHQLVEVQLKDGSTRNEVVGDNVMTFEDTNMAIHAIRPGLRPAREIRWARNPVTDQFLLYGPAELLTGQEGKTVEVLQANGKTTTEEVGPPASLPDQETPAGMALHEAVSKAPTEQEISQMIVDSEQVRFAKLPDGTWGVAGPTAQLHEGESATAHRKDGSTTEVQVGELVQERGGASWHKILREPQGELPTTPTFTRTWSKQKGTKYGIRIPASMTPQPKRGDTVQVSKRDGSITEVILEEPIGDTQGDPVFAFHDPQKQSNDGRSSPQGKTRASPQKRANTRKTNKKRAPAGGASGGEPEVFLED